MTIPVAKRTQPVDENDLPFVVEWRSSSGVNLPLNNSFSGLFEASNSPELSFLSTSTFTRLATYPTSLLAVEDFCGSRSEPVLRSELTLSLIDPRMLQQPHSTARRGRITPPPMDLRDANRLSEEEYELISQLPRVSLGRFRALFVIYSRRAAQEIDPQGLVIKSVYGNASTAEYLAHAQLLGIENLFYRLVLENAGLIPMHPGHQVYWDVEEQKRRRQAALMGSKSSNPLRRRRTVLSCCVCETQRRSAQEMLNRVCGSVDSVPFLQQVLVSSNVSSAVVSASTALSRLVTSNWLNITEQERLDVYRSLVSLLNREHFPELARPYLNRFFAKVVKYAWLDGPKFQTVFDDLRTAPDLARVLDTWTEVISEMNPQTGRDLSRFRRTSLSFRDQALLKIAEFVWELIVQINAQRNLDNNLVMHKALRLFVEMLSFDFLGACPDETNDDTSSVMVPHSFVFLRQISVPQLLFSLAHELTAKESARLALQALVLVASFRRSFYVRDEDRRAVLYAMLAGSGQLISGSTPGSQRLLNDPDCLHQVCRLIGRLKTGEAVSDLVDLDGFQQWLAAVWQLTERFALSTRGIEEASSSRFYLLGFWAQISLGASRMTTVPEFVREAVHRVIGGFIEELIHGESGESAIEETDVVEQCELFSLLISSSKHFAATTLHQALTQGAHRRVNVAWCVHLMGVFLQVVSEQKVDGSAEETLGKLAAISGLVFQNMRSRAGDAQTEIANLAFLEGLRKTYLAEQARKSSGDSRDTAMEADSGGFVSKLMAVLQLSAEKELLSLCIEKIIFNLNSPLCENELVLKRTIQLFQDFATSVSFVETAGDLGFGPQLVQGGKLLLELPVVQSLMQGAHRELGFLQKSSNLPHFGKYRTQLYHVLAKVVFMDAPSSSGGAFKTFMAPMAQTLAGLWQSFQQLSASGQLVQESSVLQLLEVVGTLARDLRGVCMAALNQETYRQVFDFLVDDPRLHGKSRLTLFTGTLEPPAHPAANVKFTARPVQQATMAILKFLAEFTLNRQSRINFDANSPGGILLFREACKSVMAVGRFVLPSQAGPAVGGEFGAGSLYRERLKPVGVALSVLNHALQGQYANMALFELYGDQALSSALSTGVSMVLSVNASELLRYNKVMKPVYTFLEQCIAKTNQIAVVVENPNVQCVVQVMHFLEEGLLAFDGTVAMQSCTILEALCSWLFEHRTSLSGTALASVIPQIDQRLRAALALLVQLLVQGEFTSIWSLSRPLLPLILLERQHWAAVTSDITNAQLTDERKKKLNAAFQAVMDNIPEELTQKTRENFTKHVYDLSAALKQQ